MHRRSILAGLCQLCLASCVAYIADFPLFLLRRSFIVFIILVQDSEVALAGSCSLVANGAPLLHSYDLLARLFLDTGLMVFQKHSTQKKHSSNKHFVLLVRQRDKPLTQTF